MVLEIIRRQVANVMQPVRADLGVLANGGSNPKPHRSLVKLWDPDTVSSAEPVGVPRAAGCRRGTVVTPTESPLIGVLLWCPSEQPPTEHEEHVAKRTS